jgi:hypothetical protein
MTILKIDKNNKEAQTIHQKIVVEMVEEEMEVDINHHLNHLNFSKTLEKAQLPFMGL